MNMKNRGKINRCVHYPDFIEKLGESPALAER